MNKFDIVDIHVSSTKSDVNAILDHPILDGTKKYTLEVAEFCCPLSSEGPLPPDSYFIPDTQLIMRVRRRNVGFAVIGNETHLGNQPLLGANFQPFGNTTITRERFVPCATRLMRTVHDMLYYMQRFFNDIKSIYVAAGGIPKVSHGGGGGAANEPLTADSLFVRVSTTPNNTIQLYLSAVFCKHFFIELSDYSSRLLGIGADNLLAFRMDGGGNLLQGMTALTNLNIIIAGTVAETVSVQGVYSLDRHFDHRVRLEMQTDMGIPPTIVWSTDNKQKVSRVIATFPINARTESTLFLNSEGASEGDVSLSSKLFSGDLVWRRAEHKVSERYEILNSQFFQNIRAQVEITRKEWVQAIRGFVFIRRAISLLEGDSWTAKLRFRTL